MVRDHVSAQTACPLDVVLVGGDGTTHEVLNGLYGAGCVVGVQVRLAVVPAGTANALYSAMYPDAWTASIQHTLARTGASDLDAATLEVMLRSVSALASALSHGATMDGKALAMLINRLGSGEGEEVTLSHLVTSHALHAAILHDAETPSMRTNHPGIERFKVAAHLNATRWTRASLTLHPTSSGILRYSPSTRSFEPLASTSIELDGPFVYLNAMLTDRLESAFVPAPLSSSLPPDAVDLVIIRPHRDPHLDKQHRGAAEEFARTWLGAVTAGMYDGGKHIDLVYDEASQPVVEYIRCAGYDFVPAPASHSGEDKNRLVCTDGSVSSADRVSTTRWKPHAAQPAPLLWR